MTDPRNDILVTAVELLLMAVPPSKKVTSVSNVLARVNETSRSSRYALGELVDLLFAVTPNDIGSFAGSTALQVHAEFAVLCAQVDALNLLLTTARQKWTAIEATAANVSMNELPTAATAEQAL